MSQEQLRNEYFAIETGASASEHRLQMLQLERVNDRELDLVAAPAAVAENSATV
jgi:hypothetical protein